MDELDRIHAEIGRLLDLYPSETWTPAQAQRVLVALASFRPHPSRCTGSVYRPRRWA